MYRHSLGAVGEPPSTADMTPEEAAQYLEELKQDCQRLRDRIEYGKTAVTTREASTR